MHNTPPHALTIAAAVVTVGTDPLLFNALIKDLDLPIAKAAAVNLISWFAAHCSNFSKNVLLSGVLFVSPIFRPVS